MSGEQWIIRDDFQRGQLAAFVATLDVSEQPYVATIRPWKKNRSVEQNRLAWKWYGEVAKQGGEYTPDEIHRIAKLTYGVPILRADDGDFAEMWGTLTGQFPTYEDQWQKLMRYLPITSLMSTEQMSRYLSDFERVAGAKYTLTIPSLYGLSEGFL